MNNTRWAWLMWGAFAVGLILLCICGGAFRNLTIPLEDPKALMVNE